ncbi:membrane protein [Methylomagnum ishizawai]|nr:membrane protein [Methylomagnum ishizawai]
MPVPHRLRPDAPLPMPAYWTPAFLAACVGSAIAPYDLVTWCLEIPPALAIFLALRATRRRFPLTPLSYAALFILCGLILLGAHYSFARVPGFDALGGGRNGFDKLAHFFQGFAPALAFRELLLRGGVVARRVWLDYLVPALCLALSAAYELVEWGVAWLLGGRAEAFLAIQGDVWDAQSDMAAALLGAVLAVALLGRGHDRQIARLARERCYPS